MIKVHKHIKYILFFIIGFFVGNMFVPSNVFAYTATIESNAPETIDFSVSWQCGENNTGQLVSCNFVGTQYYVYEYVVATNDEAITGFVAVCDTLTNTSTQTDNFIVNVPAGDYIEQYINIFIVDDQVECLSQTWDTPTEAYTFYSSPDDGMPTITVLENTAGGGSTSIWGTNNGFWGDDFTVSELKDTMVASVQQTGGNIWSLFAFAGIALAFIIALAVINFIAQSSTEKQDIKLSRRVRKAIKKSDKLLAQTKHD